MYVCMHACTIYREPCRVKYMYTEDGNKVRVSRRSGRIIPYPVTKTDFTKVAFPGKWITGVLESVQ